MGNSTAAWESGRIYQEMVFWKYAVQMLGNSDIKKIGYEYDKIKSFDDVVVIYKKGQPFRNDYINTDYIQVKFHMMQSNAITMKNLLDPKFIDASKNSFLQNVVNAYRKNKADFSKSRFILYTVWKIKDGDILNKLINNRDKTFELKILQKGKTEKSEMGALRKQLCDKLSVNEEELLDILGQICIRDGQEDQKNLEDLLNREFAHLNLIRWNGGGNTYPYCGLLHDWNKNGINLIDAEKIRTYCYKNNLFITDNNVVNILVKSFQPYPESNDNWADKCLDLTSILDKRELKPGYSWTDLFVHSRSFVHKELNHETEYHIALTTSIPVSFMLGRIFNPKSGIHIVPFQRTAEGLANWGRNAAEEQEYSAFEVSTEEELCAEGNDMAVCIGVNHKEMANIVKEFMISSQLKIGIYQSFSLESSDIYSVKNGTHAWQLAKQVNGEITKHSGFLRKGKLHLFYAGPVALIFYLGMQSIMYGDIQFYEYDAEKTHENTYYPVIAFPQEGEI